MLYLAQLSAQHTYNRLQIEVTHLIDVISRQRVVDARTAGATASCPEGLSTQPAVQSRSRHHSSDRSQVGVQLVQTVASADEHCSRDRVDSEVVELRVDRRLCRKTDVDSFDG